MIQDQDINPCLLKDIPLAYITSNGVLPLRINQDTIYIAVVHQNAHYAGMELAQRYQLKPHFIKISREGFNAAVAKYYTQASSAQEVAGTITNEDLSNIATEFETPQDILVSTADAPVIRLLNALLQEAVKKKASDVHIEPYEKELEVRIRIDGLLHKILTPPKIVQDALVTRVKIMANLDIAEKRLPQDGRIRLLIGGRDVDIRVSIIPTVHGQRVVLRLLDRDQGIMGLTDIGLTKSQADQFKSIVASNHGIFLIAGPTGSGKTTSLYAILNEINNEQKNIITVENPVEYEIKGIGQMQIRPELGLDFAAGLRSILRQDPDVIMVGEIRDKETAIVAVQASLTGHFVFSTVHTNSAAGTVIRLLDLGIEPYLIASSLQGAIAQRLVRCICVYCKEFYVPSPLESAYFKAPIPARLARGTGCSFCMNQGYSGRTGVFELLAVDETIRGLIDTNITVQRINAAAQKKGMSSLFENGMNLVREGITSIDEVLRVTKEGHAAV